MHKSDKQKIIINLIQKIFDILICIIIALILLYNAVILIKKYFYQNVTPDFFGYKAYIIISGSMIPQINVDDVVISREVPISELHVGDIISFKNENVIITHRIINISSENGDTVFKTKGDNNDIEDNFKVSSNDVEGKYIFKIKGIGKIVDLLHNYLVIGIFCVLIVLGYSHWKTKKEKIEYRKNKRRLYNLKRDKKKNNLDKYNQAT